MPTPLDQMIAAGLDAVVGDGKMFQLGTVEKRGVAMPMIGNAPPSLPFYFAYFCNLHGNADFLVEQGRAELVQQSEFSKEWLLNNISRGLAKSQGNMAGNESDRDASANIVKLMRRHARIA